MRKVLKSIILGSIVITIAACSSKKKEVNTSNEKPAPRQNAKPKRGAPTFSKILSEMDANKDGKLAKAEVKGPLATDFAKIDSDNDGFISQSEFDNAPKPQRGQRPPQR